MDTWVSNAQYPFAWLAGRQATRTLTWLNQPITLPLIFMSLPRFVIAAFNATSVFINTVLFMLFALMTLLGNLFHVLVSLREGLILPQFVCLAPRPLWVKLTVLVLHRGVRLILNLRWRINASALHALAPMETSGRRTKHGTLSNVTFSTSGQGASIRLYTFIKSSCCFACCGSPFYSGASAYYFCAVRAGFLGLWIFTRSWAQVQVLYGLHSINTCGMLYAFPYCELSSWLLCSHLALYCPLVLHIRKKIQTSNAMTGHV